MPDTQTQAVPKEQTPVKNETAALVAELVKQLAPLLKLDEGKLAESITQGIRQGNIDPVKVERQKEARKRGQLMAKQTEADRLLRESRCNHMRGVPYQGTTNIAWAYQSDGIERGLCQRCQKFYAPGVAGYDEARRVPRIGEGVIGA